MLQSKGISDLLAAEKKAQELIEEARKRKNKQQQQLGNRAQMTEESNKQTQIQIASLRTQYEMTKNDLLERIITLVCDIKPESHINARIE
ncbi:unnamed protein product [Rotaria sp. Silwood2]|nr:unnamed protein product [Rotaria sp. Silwood2]CAF4695301.1 unnamed protein product [Rotaria sp. Silwood2]